MQFPVRIFLCAWMRYGCWERIDSVHIKKPPFLLISNFTQHTLEFVYCRHVARCGFVCHIHWCSYGWSLPVFLLEMWFAGVVCGIVSWVWWLSSGDVLCITVHTLPTSPSPTHTHTSLWKSCWKSCSVTWWLSWWWRFILPVWNNSVKCKSLITTLLGMKYLCNGCF